MMAFVNNTVATLEVNALLLRSTLPGGEIGEDERPEPLSMPGYRLVKGDDAADDADARGKQQRKRRGKGGDANKGNGRDKGWG